MKPLLAENTHRKLYIYFLLLLAFGVSLGKFIMSIAVISLTLNWLFEGGFKQKLKKNKELKYAPIILSGAFIIQVLWLFQTQIFSDGVNDLRIKLPLLFLPIIIGTSPSLSNLELKKVTFSFILGLLISSIIVFCADLGFITPKKTTGTFRDISLFMSHIRYSSLVAFGMVVLLFIVNKTKYKIHSIFLFLWFLFVLYILQSITGIICLLVAVCLYISIKTYKEGFMKNTLLILILILPIISLIIYSSTIFSEYKKIKDKNELLNLSILTPLGEKYIHDKSSLETENGHLLWINIAPKEAEKTWNERSKKAFSGKDNKNQPLKYTLYRYLTSKGLKKDREGVLALSNADIKNIEEGTATSVKYNLFEKRLRSVLFELNNYKNLKTSNNHSVTQRITFLQIAKQLIKENFFFGKGTGGTKEAYKKYYANEKKGLSLKNQLRAHNQFITDLINLGLFGFIFCLASLIYPIIKTKNRINLLYAPFLIIIIINFLADDMLERQAGVTIFAAINSFLLFGVKNKYYSSEP